VTSWICATCAVEQPDTEQAPEQCRICADERQYVPPAGQRWTTLADLRGAGHRGRVSLVEPGLHGITIEPVVGIGQRAFLVSTAEGNLLWDPTGYVDDDLAHAVEAVGGVAAVAASHPHMFGVQTEWSRRFGSVPVYVAAADQGWVQRKDPAIRLWQHSLDVLPGVTLHQLGGHFPGSSVARFTGADGRGVLLSGDTAAASPDEHWTSFLRSYPNNIPLSAAVVARLADGFAALEFDRLYDNFSKRVPTEAGHRLQLSAARHIRWVRGDFDHLT
jgi:Metallo-beta-lactamase superfamily